MKNNLLIAIAALTVFSACNNKEKPTTSLDTGRLFIRECLDGDFKSAETLLYKDSENVQLFNSFKEYYGRMPEDKKHQYTKASYQINKYSDLNDSTTIINYSNDYMNKPMEIKIIRKNNDWTVDFKYTYSGNLPID